MVNKLPSFCNVYCDVHGEVQLRFVRANNAGNDYYETCPKCIDEAEERGRQQEISKRLPSSFDYPGMAGD